MDNFVRVLLLALLVTVWLAGSGEAECPVGDLYEDCQVNLPDLVVFAEQWLSEPVCLQQGLAAYWKLDETGGSVAEDSSGSGRAGVLYGEPIWWPEGGRWSGALQFDGKDDYVEIAGYQGITGARSRTVTAWIKTGDTGDIVSWGDAGTGPKWRFQIHTSTGAAGAVRVTVEPGYNIVGSTDLRDDQWHHVAAALEDDGSPDVSEVRLYVDGVREIVSYVAPRPIDTIGDTNVRIGFFNLHFNGLIDEVRIYDEALSGAAIRALALTGGVPWPGSADLDGDSTVDITDFSLLAGNWLTKAEPVVISEFMAGNSSTFATRVEGQEEYPDWIEIHNLYAVEAVELGGWYLTDDAHDRYKWRFPEGLSIQAGDYLVVFASGRDNDDYPYVDDNGYYHTNFNLDKDGGYLALVDPHGHIGYEYIETGNGYPPQQQDYSYGLYDDEEVYFSEPTPGSTNNEGFPGFVAEVQFSHERGFYQAPFKVALTCPTEGATIRYTTNGSEPTLNNGKTYAEPAWHPAGGRVNGALELDGVDDCVEMIGYKGITGTQARTVAAWIKTGKIGDILSWGSPADGAVWKFEVQNSKGTPDTIRLTVWGGYIVGETVVRDNQWHHVAVVLEDDGSPSVSEVALYVDGSREDISVVSDHAINTAGDANVKIGIFNNKFFRGLIDEVRIYDRALEAREIEALAQLSGPVEAGLAAYWKLDESSGNIAGDSAGGHDGTIMGKLDVGSTTTLRSAAFKEGLKPVKVGTHTYIFIDDVITQSPQGQAPCPLTL